MELDKVISNRKTIRKFKDKNVSDEDVYKIIQSAMLAPSAKNRQPWRFYILDDKQKEDITNMMYQWDKEYPDIHTSIKGSANEMKSANKAIIIFTPNYHSKNKKTYFKKPDYLSLGAAIEHMNLKCFDLGLGCTWLCDTLYVADEINKYLNLNDLEQVSTLIIGYPEELPERRERFPIDKLLLNDIHKDNICNSNSNSDSDSDSNDNNNE